MKNAKLYTLLALLLMAGGVYLVRIIDAEGRKHVARVAVKE